MYVSKPDEASIRGKENKEAAVLYLTDVFGIELLENRLYVPFRLPPILTRARISNTRLNVAQPRQTLTNREKTA